MTKKPWHQQFRRSAKERRTDLDGTLFHSRTEMLRWHKLRLWQIAGHIRNLKRQVPFPLESADGKVRVPTEAGKVAIYKADFVYDVKVPFKEGEWERVVEDTKGYNSREAKFRIAVFEAIHGCKVKISKG